MATFSVNQVRHLYVVKSLITPEGDDAKTKRANAKTQLEEADPGAICPMKDVNGNLYFLYKGVDGIVRTDLIKNIEYMKEGVSKDMLPLQYSTQITINPEVNINPETNKAEVVKGENYIISLNFRQFIGMSDLDTYTVFGETKAKANNSKTLAALAISLVKNMSTLGERLVDVSLNDTVIDVDTKESDLKDTYTKITITGREPEWTLGIKSQRPVIFTATAPTITEDGVEVNPFEIENVVNHPEKDKNGKDLKNGKIIADMEYFYMKERADQYGMLNWPNYVKTEYLVDPSKDYDTLDIHYAYIGANEGVQKSERDITLVIEEGGTTVTAIKEAIAGLDA